MRRGVFTAGAAQSQLDALMAQMREALANGAAADSVEVMALQAQINAVNAKADQAEATGQNARDMVLRRDPRITTLEDLATRLGGAVEAGNDAHTRLDKRIDDITLTPGPKGEPGTDGANGQPGRDGIDGEPGRDGTDGTEGASAYQLARAQGYGGTQAQWLASLKGDKGDRGDVGPAGAKGDVGSAGPQGIRGVQGDTGPTGARGNAGDTGSTGPQGPKGDTGPTGATGPQGPAGTPADMTRVAALEAQKLQIEYRDGIAVPAVVSLLNLSATVDVAVTWSTAFPDTNYTIVKPQATVTSASLIGKTDAVVKAGTQTKTGCTITVTTTALLAAGTCTIGVMAYRKG